MLAVLKADAAPEVKARAIQNLTLFLPTKWKALAKSDELHNAIADLLDDPKARITGLQLVAAARYEPALQAVDWLAADPKTSPRTFAARRSGRSANSRSSRRSMHWPSSAATRSCGPMRSARLGMIRTDKSLIPLKAVLKDEKSPARSSRGSGRGPGIEPARHDLAPRRAPEGRIAEGTRRAGRAAAPQLAPTRANGTGRCCSSPRRASSIPRTCPPSPSSPSAPAMPPAARPSGPPAPPARRSVPSATWFAASAGRSGPTSR